MQGMWYGRSGSLEGLGNADRRLDVEARQEFRPEGVAQDHVVDQLEVAELLEQRNVAFELVAPVEDIARLERHAGARSVGLILISQISSGIFSSPIERGRISSSTGGLSENSPSQ